MRAILARSVVQSVGVWAQERSVAIPGTIAATGTAKPRYGCPKKMNPVATRIAAIVGGMRSGGAPRSFLTSCSTQG